MKSFYLIKKLMKWGAYILGGFISLAGLVLVVSYIFYSIWTTDQLEKITSGGQIVETDLGPVEYVLIGEDGPITLFFHSSPGGYDSAPKSSENGQLLAPSRPGYLSTPLEVGATPSQQAKLFAALMDALNINEQVIVLGVSGGGPSAISFAAMYPERTAAMILIEPVSQPKFDGSRPAFMRSDFAIWMIFGALEKLQGPEGLVSMVVPDPDNQQLILKNSERTKQFSSLIWSLWPVSLRNAGWDNDVQQFTELALHFEDVSAPTLIIHGTADINVPYKDSELLATQIPEARLYSIEGADHMMPFTHQDEVLSVQGIFLEELGL